MMIKMSDISNTLPTFQLKFLNQIYAVEFSPYEWSQHLICIALVDEIIIGSVKFQDEDETVENIAYNPIRSFHHGTRPHAIAWSPETSLSIVPKILSFCVAGADFRIRLYNSNLSDANTYEVLEGHKDYVNSVCYEPEGEILASVSDDHTCKLWAVKEEQKYVSTFHLMSPGMSVRFHNEESGKLLVAEKNGLIRMYNIRTQQAILSLDAGMIPLVAADWSPNPLKVASMAMGELLVWDVSRSSQPLDCKTLYVEGGTTVKFSPAYEHLVATVGRPENTMKINSLRSKQTILSTKLKLFGGISWHYKLPYICVGNDRELCFWQVNTD